MNKLLLIWLLGFTAYAPIIKAFNTDHLTPSEKSKSYVFLSSVMVVLISANVISLPSTLPANALEASKKSDKQQKQRNLAGNLPDMVVKNVGVDDDNNPRVYLENAENAELNIALIWHKDRENPAGKFKVGNTLNFKPSKEKSGWLLYDKTETIAFVPVPDNLAEEHSAFF